MFNKHRRELSHEFHRNPQLRIFRANDGPGRLSSFPRRRATTVAYSFPAFTREYDEFRGTYVCKTAGELRSADRHFTESPGTLMSPNEAFPLPRTERCLRIDQSPAELVSSSEMSAVLFSTAVPLASRRRFRINVAARHGRSLRSIAARISSHGQEQRIAGRCALSRARANA